MKKALIVLVTLVAVLAIAAAGGWIYLKSTFIDFEGDYVENLDFNEMTIDGYTFSDRNGNGQLNSYEDDRLPTEERVQDLLQKMTLEEKIHLLKGSGMASALGQTGGKGVPGAAGTIVPTPRLGLPTIYLSDGPAGLRIEPTRENDTKTYYATAFPIATLLASTWNTALVQEVGTAMGKEALEYGVDVILGPGANIQRHPFNGRNFEYYSEDPVLTGQIGAAMVNGIESNGVGTSLKHYVANNQETNRYNNDVIISDRAIREIYLKGFEIIVKEAQPWTIMSSYNKVNGTATSESKELLSDILRDDWGFEGVVMTDWFGGYDASAQIRAGNDLLEPGTKRQWNAMIKAQKNGELSKEDIDTSVKRILTLILKSPKMQGYNYSNAPDLETHAKVTRESAAEGMVLLKNEEVLPLQSSANVALIGVTSYDFIAGGTGSGDVNEAYTISLEEGLRNTGFEINTLAKAAYTSHREANQEAFVKPEGMKAMFEPYTPPQIVYSPEQLQEIAASSDIAIVTIGRNSGEGGDRVEKDDFLLTPSEEKMLQRSCEAFHAVGKKVLVVLNIGGVIETASWREQPDAILLAWQGGQEGGNSVANILSGKVNPSGKLTMTFPIRLKDHLANNNFPLDGKPMSIMDIFSAGKEIPEDDKVRNTDFTIYEEGIYVGYRHFDKADLEVAYPFGYGLSYTDFTYSDLALQIANDTITISLIVQNTGSRPGKEIVQFYTAKPSSTIDRPNQELKAFLKTKTLAPGESVQLTTQIPVAALRYWAEDKAAWSLEKGQYTIRVGASSRDIRLTGDFEL